MKTYSTLPLIKALWYVSVVTFMSLQGSKVNAATIALQNGTGTFSQFVNGGPFSPAQSVDGDFTDSNGWAVFDNAGATGSEAAVWETANDLAAGDLSLTMHFLHANDGHLLGRFRFSVTTDARNTFADSLHTDGDVTANWAVLTNPIVTGPAGMTFTTLEDHSILAGGTIAAQGAYTINYSTPVNGITGLRLEALEHASLPTDGPGLFTNGNFQLTEMTLDATPVPEPSSLILWGGVLITGMFANGWRTRCRITSR